MTQDEIIKLARKTLVLLPYESATGFNAENAIKFANLVAQHEREASARLCETLWNTPTNGMATEEESYGEQCAKAIRASGKA
jgi:hypothetical protein